MNNSENMNQADAAASDTKRLLIGVAHAVNNDDMHFIIECPNCGIEHEYKGFFDPYDTDTCRKCKSYFRAEKLIMADGAIIT